jgi:hypothetical protein
LSSQGCFSLIFLNAKLSREESQKTKRAPRGPVRIGMERERETATDRERETETETETETERVERERKERERN